MKEVRVWQDSGQLDNYLYISLRRKEAKLERLKFYMNSLGRGVLALIIILSPIIFIFQVGRVLLGWW